jgi:C_GCAxxG_C_C family probable redox protein
MEESNGLHLCCSESVIIQVNRTSPLPGFTPACMRIGSMFCGGVSGYGEICGAVSGAIICLGLAMGTDASETEPVFKSKREEARTIAKRFMNDFERAWGSVRCERLLAMDKGLTESKGEQRAAYPQIKLCDHYVDWCSAKVIEILEEFTQ